MLVSGDNNDGRMSVMSVGAVLYRVALTDC
jgi:hypothetical protein